MTCRRVTVRVRPGSLRKRSLGVSAAHLRGKQEGPIRPSVADRCPVQFPDRPLNQATRAAGPMGRHLICTQVIGVRFSGGPLNKLGIMVQREDTAMAWRPCFLETRRVRFSVIPLNEIWKVDGYGSPGRFAKPRDPRVMWVQIPCLPLMARW